MDNNNRTESSGLMKSIFAAHLILILHVLLIAGIGCLVLFFRGIVQYMLWILIFGSVGIFIIGWLIRRRMIKEGKQLRDMLSLPALSGRTIEVSVLGGMASIRLEKPEDSQINENQGMIGHSQNLIGTESYHLRELTELVELLNQNLITMEEYNKFKTKIINS